MDALLKELEALTANCVVSSNHLKAKCSGELQLDSIREDAVNLAHMAEHVAYLTVKIREAIRQERKAS